MPKKPHEEHENAERYLLTYADLITLLLGLFIILYASSKTDTPKYIAVSNALRNFFNGSGRVIDYGGARGGILPNLPNPTKAGGDASLALLKDQIAEILEKMTAKPGRLMDSSMSGAGAQETPDSPIRMEIQERGLVIHLAESMFFDPGQAIIKPEGLQALDRVAPMLLETSHLIRVEGHTDNTPIHTARYPSNWHLSAERAINTAMHLIQGHGVPSGRVSVAGYGEFRPVAPNDTPEQRKENRRVDLVILNEREAAGEPLPMLSGAETAPALE